MAAIQLSRSNYDSPYGVDVDEQQYGFNNRDLFYGEDGIHEDPNQYELPPPSYTNDREFVGSDVDRNSVAQGNLYHNPGSTMNSTYRGGRPTDYDSHGDVSPHQVRLGVDYDEREMAAQYPTQSLARSDKFGQSVSLYQPDISPQFEDPHGYHMRGDSQLGNGSNYGSIEPLVMETSAYSNFAPPDNGQDSTGMSGRAYAETEPIRHVISPPKEELDIGSLVNLISRTNDVNFDRSLIINVCAYLTHITCRNETNKLAIFNHQGIRPLIHLLRQPIPQVYTEALSVLRNLAYSENMNIRRSICFSGNLSSPQGLFDIKDLLESLEPLYDVREPHRNPTDQLVFVYELIVSVIWNLSACREVKSPIIQALVKSLVDRVMLPCSGLERNQNEIITHGLPIRWTTVLNSTAGILRNVSAGDSESRHYLRNIDGLVESLVAIGQSALEQSNVDSKTVEHCICTLRNLSYALQEIVDPTYVMRIEGHLNEPHSKNCACCSGKSAHSSRYKQQQQKSNPHQPRRHNDRNGHGNNANGSVSTKSDVTVYAAPKLRNPASPRGEELLWQVSILDVYVRVMQECNNPHTLEAAVGAVQNLAACDWQPSVDIRHQMRAIKGLPITEELLLTNNDAVVRTTSTALRNLALDPRNRDLLGLKCIDYLVRILPSRPGESASPPIMESGYSLDTLASVLATLYVIVNDNEAFSKKFRNSGGDSRCQYIVSSDIFLYTDTNLSQHEKERVHRFAKALMKEVDAVLSGKKNRKSALLCSSCGPKKKDHQQQQPKVTHSAGTLHQPSPAIPSDADRASSYQNGGTFRSDNRLIHGQQKNPYISEGPPSYYSYDNPGLTGDHNQTLPRSQTGSHGAHLSAVPGSAQRSHLTSQLPSKQGTLRSNFSQPVNGADNYGYTGSRQELVLNVDDIPLRDSRENGYPEYYGNYAIQEDDDMPDPLYARVDHEAKYSMRQSQGPPSANYQFNHQSVNNNDSWV